MNGNLKRLREQKALSLTDLARITGLHRITINRVENGKQKPMPGTIRKLAEALGINVEELTSNWTTIDNSHQRVLGVDDER